MCLPTEATPLRIYNTDSNTVGFKVERNLQLLQGQALLQNEETRKKGGQYVEYLLEHFGAYIGAIGVPVIKVTTAGILGTIFRGLMVQKAEETAKESQVCLEGNACGRRGL